MKKWYNEYFDIMNNILHYWLHGLCYGMCIAAVLANMNNIVSHVHQGCLDISISKHNYYKCE